MANRMFANVPTAITRSASLKSESGERVIRLGPLVVNTLEGMAAGLSEGRTGFGFPNTLGKIWDHADIVSRYVWPTMVAAGVVDDRGEAEIQRPACLRHSMHHGSSTGKLTAAWSYAIKTVQVGSDIHRCPDLGYLWPLISTH